MDTALATYPSKIQAADSRLRVVIADDHQLIAGAVATVLEQTGRFSVTMVDGLAGLLKEIAEGGEAEVILLDLNMKGMIGLPSVEKVLQRNASGNVILFSGHADDNFVQSAVACGAAGYIPKTMPLNSLVSAINLVISGQAFVPISRFSQARGDSTPTAKTLTSVELSVLRQISEGATNKEVARNMIFSEVTVKMHVRNICEKLGAKNRTHAAMLAREQMLI